jgi:hypothetical protein
MIGRDAARRVPKLSLRLSRPFDMETGPQIGMARGRYGHMGLTKRVLEVYRRKTLPRKPTIESGVLTLCTMSVNLRESDGYRQECGGRGAEQRTRIRE